MSNLLTQSQHDTIRHLLETSSMPKLEIARRFDCSSQTIHRINKSVSSRRSRSRIRSPREIEAKRELDVAFNAFERCNSPENYRRLLDARYDYEITSRLPEAAREPISV